MLRQKQEEVRLVQVIVQRKLEHITSLREELQTIELDLHYTSLIKL